MSCEKGWLNKVIYPPGCTDESACNYEPDASKDDDSCFYEGNCVEDSDCQQDCLGVWGGTAQLDCLGVCNGNNELDCAGICSGTTQSEDCYITDIDGNVYQNVQIGE